MTCHARITQIGNSKGVRLPKTMVRSLGTTEVTLERTTEGILIRPASPVPPLNQWAAVFAKANTSLEQEIKDWDVTLNDGLEGE